MSRRSGSYPKELRDRAVRMVAEVRSEHASEWAAIESVASKLGIGSAQTVHNWVRKAEVDAGTRPGTTSVEAAEMRKLRSENRELRRANEILKPRIGLLRGGSSNAHTAAVSQRNKVSGGPNWNRPLITAIASAIAIIPPQE